MAVMVDKEEYNLIQEYLGFAQKEIKIKTGRDVRIYCDAFTGKLEINVIPPQELVKVMAEEMGLSKQDINSKDRVSYLINARAVIVMLLLKYYKIITLKKIGLLLGGKDHTTIIHTKRRAQQWMEANDAIFMEQYTRVDNRIKEYLKTTVNYG